MTATGGPFLWLAAMLLAAFALPAWQRPIMDPDLWWLLWSGDMILNGSLPAANLLSWTAEEHPWTSHEILVAALYAAAGIEGMPVLRGLVVSATLLLVLLASWRPRCAWASLLALGWVILMVRYGRTERALSVGNLLLAAEMALLVAAPARRWAMPAAALLVAVWASAHGSFVVGLLALAIFDWRWGLAAAAGTLANPYGWHVWELVVGYGTGADVRGLVHATIEEWMPPRLDDPWTLARLAALALAAGLLAWRRQWRPLLLCAALTALSLKHVRFLDIAAIALAPWLAIALAEVLPERRERLAAAPLLAAAVLLAALPGSPGLDRNLYPLSLPFAGLQNSRLWNDHYLGGFLGYHGVKVFWDSRNDCVPFDVYRDGVAIERETPGWQDILDRWRIDTVVTASAGKVAALAQSGWRRTAREGEVTVLTRP